METRHVDIEDTHAHTCDLLKNPKMCSTLIFSSSDEAPQVAGTTCRDDRGLRLRRRLRSRPRASAESGNEEKAQAGQLPTPAASCIGLRAGASDRTLHRSRRRLLDGGEPKGSQPLRNRLLPWAARR